MKPSTAVLLSVPPLNSTTRVYLVPLSPILHLTRPNRLIKDLCQHSMELATTLAFQLEKLNAQHLILIIVLRSNNVSNVKSFQLIKACIHSLFLQIKTGAFACFTLLTPPSAVFKTPVNNTSVPITVASLVIEPLQ